MVSLINGRKVDVHILYRSKLNDRKIWTKEECSIEGTEATLRHPRDNVYVMEVSERDAPSKIVLEIDFRKVKTYTMRARCWHEVKYEGRLIALHFKEDETFDDFYSSLERVLKMYKKYTKPKNGENFLREVEMFQLRQLKPVEGGRRGRGVSLGTAEEEERPSSSGTVPSRKAPVLGQTRSLDVFERQGRSRLPDLVENAKPSKKTPPSTLQKAKNKPSEAAAGGGGAIFHRPLPKTPFNSKPQRTPPPPNPPPRISGGFQQSVEADIYVERSDTRDSSDEENNVEVRPNYLAFAEDDDDEAFSELPLPPPPPQTRCSSTDSSASESTIEPSRPKGNQQKKPKQSNNDEVSGRSPPRTPQDDTPNFCERHTPTTSDPLSPNRGTRPPSEQLAKVKKLIQLQKQNKDPPPRDQGCPHHGPRVSHPSPPPASPPVQPSQLTTSSTYGMAMHWNCVRCTLQNDFWKLTCAACEWLRTDAWGCSECATVYSNDLVSCVTCDVWRCRNCTAINRGKRNETTRCPVCDH